LYLKAKSYSFFRIRLAKWVRASKGGVMGASRRGTLTSVIAGAFARRSSINQDQNIDVAQLLNDYYGAFGASDTQRANACYDIPVMFISNDNILVATSPAESAAWLAKQFELLRPRAFSRNKLTKLGIKKLSDGVAMASGIDVRYDKVGEELARSGITYLLHKSGGEWKISVLIFHDVTVALELS
jgi:NTF2-like protein (DUF6841)